MRILVIDDEWPSIYSGKWLRIINIFKKFRIKTKLHFLYIGNHPPSNPHLLRDIFDPIDTAHLTGKSSVAGRILNLLFLKPGEYAKWRYREDYLRTNNYIKKIVKENGINLIHIFSFFCVQYCLRLHNVFRIWDVGDSLYLKLKRQQGVNSCSPTLKEKLYLQRIYNYEQEVIQRTNKTIFVSAIDANLHKNLSKKIKIFPNGVALDYFNPLIVREEYPSLIFTGHMCFEPNVSAVLYFVKKILPLVKKEVGQLKFYIVGAEPTDEVINLGRIDGVKVTGFVDDIRQYLAKSSVFIAPLISGSGIKNKLLQAMAMGIPVVSTTLGVEALSVRNNQEVLVADSPEQFAQGIINLLRNDKLRKNIAQKARNYIKEKYNWDKTIEEYNSLYDEFQQNIGDECICSQI